MPAPGLRLLTVVHCYPPATGGVETAVHALCEGLAADHGFDVTVATTDAMGLDGVRDRTLPRVPPSPSERHGNPRVLRHPVRTRTCRIAYRGQFAAWRLRLPGNDRLRTWGTGPISPALRRTAQTHEADVILSAPLPCNHVLYPLGRRDGTPVVLMAAAHPQDEWGYERPHLLRAADRCFASVAFTEPEGEWLRSRGVGDVRVIPLGLAEPPSPRGSAFRRRHAIPDEAPLVAYVGQQGSHKGLDTLVAAVPGLLEQQPDARLVIGGARTPWSQELLRLIATLPVAARERVVVEDDLSPQEKADLLGDCDVFASPSRAESFGLTTLEAWAARKPAVLGDTPSQRAVVGGSAAAEFVPVGEEGALVTVLSALLADAPRRERMGRAGRDLLDRHYRHGAVVDRWAELLTEAAGSRA